MPRLVAVLIPASCVAADSDELVPEDGKDEIYDNIMSEINDLEEELKAELKKIRKETGYDFPSTASLPPSVHLVCCSLDASYWHSAQGTKVSSVRTRTMLQR